jgi:2-polyprenyl-3-methyl-5-hydroxy-6-metoxy-1,4-benzoquinol methylase
MKYRVVDMLQDVVDGTPLRVADATTKAVEFDRKLAGVQCKTFCALKSCPVTPTSVSPDDCVACYSQEIIDGELVSSSGNRYSIVNGIPRLLSKDTSGWVQKNQETFSLEWKMFRFGERNWGQDIDYRKQLFVRGMGVEPDELNAKVIFDAGCGSGLLSMEVAESYGMEVVAMDLASGIEQAYAHNKNPFVYYIQGSVVEPPLKPRAVDFIYCAGVLVAIPDPKVGFKALLPALKPGGRYFIWMYHPIDATHHPNDRLKMLIYNWLRAHIVSRLPIRSQHRLFLAAMPLYILKREVGRVFGSKITAVTWREKMQDLIDMFSPVCQHRFTSEEILKWYGDSELVNARVAYRETYGFAVRGDIPVPANGAGQAGSP